MHEPGRDLPVIADCDVAVFGGGPAGACAAAAASRAGMSVVLVERYGFLGGMATAANVNGWDSLFGMDRATQIIGGLPEEIIRRLEHLNAATNLADDGRTGPWLIDSESTKLVYDDVIVSSGAKLLFHTWLAGSLVDNGKVVAALVESKSGRAAIKARIFIDCTGDADLIRHCGHPVETGDGQGHFQPPTSCFRVGGVSEPRTHMRKVQTELFKQVMEYNCERYPCQLWGRAGVFDKTDWTVAGTRIPGIDASDVHSFTKGELESRYQMRWLMKQMRRFPGYEKTWLVDIPTQLGIRETHRIVADYMMTREDVLYARHHEDSIAQGTWPIDIHNPKGAGTRLEYLDGTVKTVNADGTSTFTRWDGQPDNAAKRDSLCWHVPYRSLIPRELTNVLAAGRCIGAHHDAAGAIRVMIIAMQLGQAAGIAASLAIESGNVRTLDINTLRLRLRDANVPLLHHPISDHKPSDVC